MAILIGMIIHCLAAEQTFVSTDASQAGKSNHGITINHSTFISIKKSNEQINHRKNISRIVVESYSGGNDSWRACIHMKTIGGGSLVASITVERAMSLLNNLGVSFLSLVSPDSWLSTFCILLMGRTTETFPDGVGTKPQTTRL